MNLLKYKIGEHACMYMHICKCIMQMTVLFRKVFAVAPIVSLHRDVYLLMQANYLLTSDAVVKSDQNVNIPICISSSTHT